MFKQKKMERKEKQKMSIWRVYYFIKEKQRHLTPFFFAFVCIIWMHKKKNTLDPIGS